MPDGCKVADIFCGTGSFGIEALSRGASGVTFVDLSREAVEVLGRNIEKARYKECSRVVRSDAFKAGAPLAPGEELYDLAFVDPPYPLTEQTGQGSRLGKMLLVMNEQMRPGGLVLVRTHKNSILDDCYGELKVIDRRDWGNMAETFLQLQNEQYQLQRDIEDAIEDTIEDDE